MKTRNRMLAERIVNEIFRNGFGDKAGRLVLMLGARDLGGWGEGTLTDRIEAILNLWKEK